MDKEIDKSILRRERRRKLIISGTVGVAVVGLAIWGMSGMAPTINSRDITLGTADEGPLDISIAASGRIVPAYEEIINSPVETRVLKVYAQPGDSVKAGTPLLQLDLEQEETSLGKLQDARTRQQQELRQLELTNKTNISDLEMQIKVSEMNVNRLRIEVSNERRLDSIGSGTGDRVCQAETAYHAGVLELEQLRTRLRNERLRTAAAERGQQLNVTSADRDIEMMAKTLQRGSIPSPLDGVLTFILSKVGLPKSNLLTYKQYFQPLYIAMNIWQELGWDSIIYFAALAGVDGSLYEAAYVDGAGRWRQMWHVTLPSILPTIVILLVMRVGNLLSLGWDRIFLMYNDMVMETADVISTYVYRTGMVQMQYSFAAAVGLMNSLVNVVLLIGANAMSRKLTNSSLW